MLFDKSSLEKNGIERSDRKNKKLGLALEHFLLKKLPVRNHTNSRATNSRNKLSRLLNSWTWAEKNIWICGKVTQDIYVFLQKFCNLTRWHTFIPWKSRTCEVDPGHCSSTKKLVKWIRNARVTTTQKKSWSIWGAIFTRDWQKPNLEYAISLVSKGGDYGFEGLCLKNNYTSKRNRERSVRT